MRSGRGYYVLCADRWVAPPTTSPPLKAGESPPNLQTDSGAGSRVTLALATPPADSSRVGFDDGRCATDQAAGQGRGEWARIPRTDGFFAHPTSLTSILRRQSVATRIGTSN